MRKYKLSHILRIATEGKFAVTNVDNKWGLAVTITDKGPGQKAVKYIKNI